MKKIFVAAAILAMFAAVSCKNNEKKAEEAAEAPATETVATEANPTVGEQIEAKAGEAAVEAADAALDAAVENVKANL